MTFDPEQMEAEQEILRNGGPTRTGGVQTTTGSSAGPGGSGRAPQRHVEPGALTTTGDATTGGMSSPAEGSTSDASGPAAEAGDFTDR
ncbi:MULTISPECIES: hypothetical protein [Dactylosporangium]|uniref:Uncharacterized protein n=2 Tax=Dactylosporangium TaxID=35753 RepID=A0A9W6NP90_9ACTN|nr:MULTISPECIES: hypothetical protein [Dactylosporangium]UAB92547.1 hypothetical protein Dvina_29865 [Dactylosporangium vinaceum]UWZ40998.1 hypothetical protein Dmats_25060 [Dactylosporangium matsuzakiense]GLL04795.1 hypothetical protein GCM10017581_065420 [Dactylosporangium matsuzakiense]